MTITEKKITTVIRYKNDDINDNNIHNDNIKNGDNNYYLTDDNYNNDNFKSW